MDNDSTIQHENMSCPEIGLHFCVNLFQDKTIKTDIIVNSNF